MRAGAWLAVAVSVACGGSPAPGSGSGAGPKHALTIHVAGSGAVQGPSFSCTQDCVQTLDGTVHLNATPAAGSVFAGWQGACSGTADCNVAMTGDAQVTAVFTATPPPPPPPPAPTHTLTVAVAGGGSVTSTPAGISCPGTCSATFAEGARVALAAAASAGNQLASWSGACTGAGDCTVMLSSDASVTASFSPVPPDECAGVMPAPPGAPVTGTVDFSGQSSRNSCDTATTDLQGNVAALLGGMGPDPWTIWTSAGVKSPTHFSAFQVVPQPSGFQGLYFDSTGYERTFAAFGPDGTLLRQMDIAPASGLSWVEAFGATTGGSVVLWLECRTELRAGMVLHVMRFDAKGAKVSDVAFGGPGQGCVSSSMAALSDDLDHTLVVLDTGGGGGLGFGVNKTIARWLDRAGNALTDWFEVPAAAASPSPLLRPLIGGGAVLGSVGPVWHASIGNGTATIDDPPPFARDQADVRIARGGKAYAVVPTRGAAIDLWSPSGKHCGALEIPGATRLQPGLDGTVIDMGGSDGCSLRWWPHLLGN